MCTFQPEQWDISKCVLNSSTAKEMSEGSQKEYTCTIKIIVVSLIGLWSSERFEYSTEICFFGHAR